MQCRDVRVANKNFRIAAKDFWLEVGNHASRAVAACSADNRLHFGVEPHPHEVCRATFVLLAGKTSHLEDVGIEQYLVPGALECLGAAHELSLPRRV